MRSGPVRPQQRRLERAARKELLQRQAVFGELVDIGIRHLASVAGGGRFVL